MTPSGATPPNTHPPGTLTPTPKLVATRPSGDVSGVTAACSNPAPRSAATTSSRWSGSPVTSGASAASTAGTDSAASASPSGVPERCRYASFARIAASPSTVTSADGAPVASGDAASSAPSLHAPTATTTRTTYPRSATTPRPRTHATTRASRPGTGELFSSMTAPSHRLAARGTARRPVCTTSAHRGRRHDREIGRVRSGV
ncbi:hypothetical protein [Cellulosimicrobium sp. CUA-896]|uniref:hypothetical protein n=1 Tax=Cellulosimicrobium sp. CUA-896 TaxID=1517881 RepID=UPI00095D29D0|nr:hypothetical protein [Cellulosimicrobium sp. CUA-896]OLT53303.1 hypothetical protein BJF88_12125 [Cellulosimicrobium sp. CUA-896]